VAKALEIEKDIARVAPGDRSPRPNVPGPPNQEGSNTMDTLQSAAPKLNGSVEGMLARIEIVRTAQRREGNFDCFAKAINGYCDQVRCAYHADCLRLSRQSV